MSVQCVVYEIHSHANGGIAITVTTTTGMTVTRHGLACHAEAQTALQNLRAIVAALGLDLIQAGGPSFA